MRIKHLELYNFKSFKRAQIVFNPDINVIIGPNGSGKSNICDSLKFLLGEKSLTQLRAKSSKDLVYRGAKDSYVKGIFETPEGDQVELIRGIHNDKVFYKINGKKVPRSEYVSFLAIQGITNSSRIFILQGQIDKLVSMGKKDREQFFADGAGTIHFDLRKEEAMKEISFVDQRINEISLVLGEKLGLLEELEKEAERAREFLSLKQRIDLLKKSIAYKRYKEKEAILKKEKEEILELGKRREELLSQIEGIKQRIKEIEEEKLKLSQELTNNERAKLYAELEKEKEELEKQRSQLRELETIRFEKSKLHKQLLEKRQQLAQEVQSLERYATKKEENEEIDKALNELSQLSQELSQIEQRLGALKGKKESLGALTSEFGSIEEINKELSKINQKIKESFNLEREYSQKLKQLDEKLSELRKKQGELRAYAVRSSLGDFIKELRNTIPGIYDLVINLIEFDPKYAEAVDAMGGRLLNIVVEDLEVAKKLSQIFRSRRLGRVSIIPLRELMVEYIPDVNVGLGRLKNYISSDPKFQKVIDYVFGDVVLVRDFDEAKAYVGKYRMVTLAGEFFEKSGVVSVGKSHQAISSTKVLKQLEEEISRLEQEKQQLNRSLYEHREYVQTLRERKSRLEQQLQIIKRAVNMEEFEKINKAITELEERKKKLEEKKTSLEHYLESFGDIVKERERLAKLKGEYEQKYSQLNELDEQIKNLDKELKELDIQIRVLGDKNRIKELATRQKEAAYLRMDENLRKLMKLSSEKEEELRDLGLKQQKLLEELSKIEKRYYKLEGEIRLREQELQELKHSLGEIDMVLNETIENMEKELTELESKLASLGDINFRAQEQYERVNEDVKDIKERIEKLRREKQELINLIHELEIKKQTYFREYISKVNEKFKEYTLSIPNFGEGHIEYDKEISIKLIRGGKAIRIEALSGGERSLLGLILVFAMNSIRSLPLAVFDEVDAALDKLNVQRLTQFIKEQSKATQFIIVTHNPLTAKIGKNVIGVAKQRGASVLAQVNA